MSKPILVIAFMAIQFFSVMSMGQDTEKDGQQEIEKILSVQANCWNEDNIEGFMSTYWKSEELTFSSGGKTTRGWQATLDGYEKRYPAGNMGALTFDHLETTVLGDNVALVLGQWHLRYDDDDDRDGNFSLVLRKFDNGWKIVHDHSSCLESEQTDEEN